MDDLLLTLAVLPGFLLIRFVYQLDSIEKEPTELLTKLVFVGAAACVPAIVLELIAEGLLDFFFPMESIIYYFFEAFLGIALIEELCKLYVLKKYTWTHPAFNFRFDAIVYAVCVSMGFAILENIFYCMEGGIDTAFARAITSIPGHGVFGVFMGIYYGQAKELLHMRRRFDKDHCLHQALIVPALLHGFYDFCLLSQEDEFIIVFLLFVAVLFYNTYKKIKQLAREDRQIH